MSRRFSSEITDNPIVTTDLQEKFDRLLTSPQFTDDLYPIGHQLRREAPVHWCEPWGGWVLSRYHDVKSVRLDQDTFRSGGRIIAQLQHLPQEAWEKLAPLREHFSVGLLHCDQTDHTRLRNLVGKAFTPHVVEGMRPRIQILVDKLLDAVEPTGRMDAIEDFAFPLPATVISEMLGVPPSHRDQFRRWATGIISFQDTARPSIEEVLYAQDCLLEARKYFGDLFEQRRRQPRDDLISGLVAAEQEGDKLSEAELMSTCVTLLVGGHETTTGLISNGLLLLLEFPEQTQKLKDDASLIPKAVDEILRYESPVQRGYRLVVKDAELDGKLIRRGQLLILLAGAANRDPEYFLDPDRFDVTREGQRHLTFGSGVHFCLGAPLATLEAVITFETLLRRFPEMKLETRRPQWADAAMLRRLKSLPVALR